MARYHFLGIARDTFGNVEPNSEISIYENNSSTAAIVYDDQVGGTPISAAPQITTDAYGRFDFWVDDGDYQLNQLFDVEAAGLTYDSIEIMRGIKVHHALDELTPDDDHPQYAGVDHVENITGRWTFQFPLSGAPQQQIDTEIDDIRRRLSTHEVSAKGIFDSITYELRNHAASADILLDGLQREIRTHAASGYAHGHDIHQETINNTGVQRDAGQVVYISGWNAGQEMFTIDLADADDPTTMPAAGIIREDIANGGKGEIITTGRVTDLDTQTPGWSIGDELYVSTTPGVLTNTKPVGTAEIQKVALVTRVHSSKGEIFVIGAGRTNDIPNLADQNVWLGNTSGAPVATHISNLSLSAASVEQDNRLQEQIDTQIDSVSAASVEQDNRWSESVSASLASREVFHEDDSGNIFGGVDAAVNLAAGSEDNFYAGDESGNEDQTGGWNIGIGYQALKFGDDNWDEVAIGYQAMTGVTGQNHWDNIGIGYRALFGITQGTGNVAIGSEAAQKLTTAGSNVFVGQRAGQYNVTGNSNVAIGNSAGRTTLNNSYAQNTIIGYAACGTAALVGPNNVVMGHQTGANMTGAENNVVIGAVAGTSLTTGRMNVFVGMNSGNSITTGRKNVIIGFESSSGVYSAALSGSVFLGYRSGYYERQSGRLHISNTATKTPLVSGDFDRSILGIHGSVRFPTSDVKIDEFSSDGTLADNSDTAIPTEQAVKTYADSISAAAVEDRVFTEDTASSPNIFGGTNAGSNLNIGGGASDNFLAGYDAGVFITTGGGNIAIGNKALYQGNGDPWLNIAIGQEAGYGQAGNDQYENTWIGYRAGYMVSTAESCVFVGLQAGYEITSGKRNVGMGNYAGEEQTSGDDNVQIGHLAGEGGANQQVWYRNTFIGSSAGRLTNTGSTDNTNVGYRAGYGNRYGTYNVSVGVDAGYNQDTGGYHGCVNLGSYAGHRGQNGMDNFMGGFRSGYFNVNGSRNVVIGSDAGYGTLSNSYDNNVFLGFRAGFETISASGSVFIGYKAGYHEKQGGRLYIANSDTRTPLVSGDFDRSLLAFNSSLRFPTSNVRIDEFSDDGTLAGNSDTVLPTEQAVKTYSDSLSAASREQDERVREYAASYTDVEIISVSAGSDEKDQRLQEQLDALSVNKIQEGNSGVVVNDSSPGTITVSADGSTISQATTAGETFHIPLTLNDTFSLTKGSGWVVDNTFNPLNDFTEEDGSGYVTLTSTDVQWANSNNGTTTYVYWDGAANYFDGNYKFDFEFTITSTTNYGDQYLFALANDLKAIGSLLNESGEYGDCHAVHFNEWQGEIALTERHGTAAGNIQETNQTGFSTGTTYYATIWRDESIGTNGTLYLEIFSNSARTTQVGSTFSLTLNEKQDFRYFYSYSSMLYAGPPGGETGETGNWVNYTWNTPVVIGKTSNDGTLVNASPSAFVTEYAVKTYSDTVSGNLQSKIDSLSSNKISEGNSGVVVNDIGQIGTITISADGGIISQFTSAGITTQPDEDKAYTFGRVKIGQIPGWSDYAGLAHFDRLDQNNYAFAQHANGNTYLNATNGQALSFRINGGYIGQILSTGLQLGAAAIVNEFSTDGTLAGNSDTAVPTEQAVKTYTDSVSAQTVFHEDVNSNIFGGTNSHSEQSAGTDNFFAGVNAGLYGDGSYNIGIGTQALEGTTGQNYSNNIGIGYQVGLALTTGGNNVLIGYAAGTAFTNGGSNVAIGYRAEYRNVGGDYNIAIGPDAAYGVAAQTHNKCISIGYRANFDLTTGGSNISIGYQAATNITTDDESIFIGEDAAYQLKGGNGSNVVIGHDAGYGRSGESTYTGATLIGWAAGFSLTTGGQATFYGAYAGYNLRTGGQNTMLGYGAGYNNTNTSQDYVGCVGIGYQALYTNDTGDYNIAIGSQSLYNATGANNTVIGHNAGFYIGTGSDNILIGYRAGFGSSGNNQSNNTVIGSRANERNRTGTGSVVIGYQAGYGTSGQSHSYNVLIGYMAGWDIGTNGNYNVAIGYQSGVNLNTGTNNVILGTQAGSNLIAGGGNVFIGYRAGYDINLDDRLIIANTNVGSPLVSGDFSRDLLAINGSLRFPTSNVRIDEFSDDGTLAGNSNTVLPTEQAVKTYSDNISAASIEQDNRLQEQLDSVNRIKEGDSGIVINDTGTGSIIVSADNNVIATLHPTGGEWEKTQYFADVDLQSNGTSAVNWNLQEKQLAVLSMDHSYTIRASGGPHGMASFSLLVKQTSGSGILSFEGSNRDPILHDWLWESGVAPTLSVGASDEDVLTFLYRNGKLYGTATYDFS